MSVSINDILEKYDELPFEDKEYVFDILKHRMIDYRRKEIAERGYQAEKDYIEGKSKTGSIEDLFKDLHSD